MRILLVLGGVFVVVVAVLFMRQRGTQLQPVSEIPDWAVPRPPINVAADPKGTGKLVNDCHAAVTGGSVAVGSKYGVPASIGAAGAKINPYYWYCDAGGAVVNTAKKIWNKIF